MNRTQQHFERFAQLRAAHPEEDYERIMEQIYEEEIEQAEREHYRMLDSLDEERAQRYTDGF